MIYHSKEALLTDIKKEHDGLSACLAQIPESRYTEPGVWGDDWTISDLIAHLAEWQFMFLTWYRDGLKGAKVEVPAPGYKVRETPKLNRAIWLKHRGRSVASVRADFESGYSQILDIVENLSAEQLLAPGHFNWTGKNPLRTYIGANTASHYRFAMKVIKRWRRAGGV